MNLFFDTEFTGLHKDTTLISIGIVAENGKKFYAEFTDYDREQCTSWISDNVLPNTILGGNQDLVKQVGADDNTTTVIAKKELLMIELEKWLNQFDEIQFVSDVCHYDFILLIDIFGEAFDLPKKVSPVCHDINQDIARHYDISERSAFDINREDLVRKYFYCTEINEDMKHNALHDAEIIRIIYEGILSK